MWCQGMRPIRTRSGSCSVRPTRLDKSKNLRIEAQVGVVGSPRRYGRWNGCTMKPAVVKKTHGTDASS